MLDSKIDPKVSDSSWTSRAADDEDVETNKDNFITNFWLQFVNPEVEKHYLENYLDNCMPSYRWELYTQLFFRNLLLFVSFFTDEKLTFFVSSSSCSLLEDILSGRNLTARVHIFSSPLNVDLQCTQKDSIESATPIDRWTQARKGTNFQTLRAIQIWHLLYCLLQCCVLYFHVKPFCDRSIFVYRLLQSCLGSIPFTYILLSHDIHNISELALLHCFMTFYVYVKTNTFKSLFLIGGIAHFLIASILFGIQLDGNISQIRANHIFSLLVILVGAFLCRTKYVMMRKKYVQEEEVRALKDARQKSTYVMRSYEKIIELSHANNANFDRMVTNKNAQLLRGWKIHPSQLLIGKTLGVGEHCDVYKGVHGNTDVAIKQWKDYSPNGITIFEEECITMASLQHKSIVRFLGCNIKAPSLYLVLEYCSRGTLEDYMNAPKILFGKHLVQRAFEIATGLDYIHKNSFIHRDIKSRNILMRRDHSAAISDFSSSMIRGMKVQDQIAGTPIYIAPEVLRQEQVTAKSDIYSFGILLFELSYVLHRSFLGKDYRNAKSKYAIRVLFEQRENLSSGTEILTKVLNGWRPKIYDSLELLYPKFGALIKQCWNNDPKSRPSAQQCSDELAKVVEAKEEQGLDSVQCAKDLKSMKFIEEMEQQYLQWSVTSFLGIQVYKYTTGGDTPLVRAATEPVAIKCLPKMFLQYLFKSMRQNCRFVFPKSSSFHQTSVRGRTKSFPYPRFYYSIISESVRMLEDGTIIYSLPAYDTKEYDQYLDDSWKKINYCGYWLIRPKDNHCTVQRFVTVRRHSQRYSFFNTVKSIAESELSRISAIRKQVLNDQMQTNELKEEYVTVSSTIEDRILWVPFKE